MWSNWPAQWLNWPALSSNVGSREGCYFKYMSATGLKRLLHTEAVRFTQPGVFNDPFEMPAVFADEAERALWNTFYLPKLASDAANEIMRETTQNPWRPPVAAFQFPLEVIKGMPMTRDEATWALKSTAEPGRGWATATQSARALAESRMTDQERREVARQRQIVERLREIDEEVGIFSLTRSHENLLMWAHYADEHRGAVVEIDIAAPEFVAPSVSGQEAREVRYSSSRPRLLLEDEVRFEPFFTKSPQWAYEEEYRIVRRLKDATEVESTAGDGYPVRVFSCPSHCIRSVIVGQRFYKNRMDLIGAIRDRLMQLKHILVRQARLDLHEYRLRFEEIEPRVLGESMNEALSCLA